MKTSNPAFPTPEFHNEQCIGTYPGLTKREFIICHLAAGFAANPELTGVLADQWNGNYQKQLAALAISTADAVIASLDLKPDELLQASKEIFYGVKNHDS